VRLARPATMSLKHSDLNDVLLSYGGAMPDTNDDLSPSDVDSTKPSPWNSLEISKLIVGALTPIAIGFFTVQTNKALVQETEVRARERHTEETQRQQRERVESEERERFAQVVRYRAELWRTISPQMNDLYCYFLYVGHWKQLAPNDILGKKRELDKQVYSNSPFFSPTFLAKYNAFMNEAFQTGNGWGLDATLKSPPIRDLDRGMESMFARKDGQYIENTDRIHVAYFAWLMFAADEMKLQTVAPSKPNTPSTEEINRRLSTQP
jgi:hypothetical protein